MKVKAIKGFSGERFSMFPGEIREVQDTETVRELLRIGYLEDAGVPGNPEQTAPESPPGNPEQENTEVLNEAKRGKSKRN